MTDKELLKLAAAAIGRNDLRIVSEFIQGDFRDGLWDDLNEVVWNPLTDDGDALRLAVDLCLFESFDFSMDLSMAQSADNPYAATRRAIVRAAAEIGKAI